MTSIKLYSVKEGKLVDYELSIENDEVVAAYGDSTIKFPGGLTSKQFKKLVDEHNKVNAEQIPISEEELKAQEKLQALNEKLLDSLE